MRASTSARATCLLWTNLRSPPGALGKALVKTERRVDVLIKEVAALQRSREKVFKTPPIEWIAERISKVQEVLERRTAQSAQALRNLLGPIRLEPVTPDIGGPFYRAVTAVDALALIETPSGGTEGGSNSLQRWRRRESNPGPRSRRWWRLRA
jgi:hypothetical protein